MRGLALFFIFSHALVWAQWQPLAYKPLTENEITLNVAEVINPRFRSFSEDQMKRYLKEAQKVVYEHYGVKVHFKRLKAITVRELFKFIPQSVQKELYETIYDFKRNKGDKKHLEENLYEELSRYVKKQSLDDMIAYAEPYITVPLQEKTLKALTHALIETEIERLQSWLEVDAFDGHSVIDDHPYNEWLFWDALGHFKNDIDILVTNQLIASAEYFGQDIHSALRGGIVAGTTSYQKNSPYDSFVFTTTFFFMDNHDFIKALRNGKNYSDKEAATYAGAYLAHEIGHMLFRFGHPFNQESCVMNPAKLLHFKEWYESIDPKKCPVGSSKAMTPGSETIYYNDAW